MLFGFPFRAWARAITGAAAYAAIAVSVITGPRWLCLAGAGVGIVTALWLRI